jgi:hypothetical protein
VRARLTVRPLVSCEIGKRTLVLGSSREDSEPSEDEDEDTLDSYGVMVTARIGEDEPEIELPTPHPNANTLLSLRMGPLPYHKAGGIRSARV